MEDKKFALLIDADNISAKYVSYIMDEIEKQGKITYKRIYGDWTTTQNTKWKSELLEYSITPIQQFNNTIGKNSTDSALIIDAMDILYNDKVDGFCIVSSDSDFTRLASRLQQEGKLVIGMGEKKTPRAFIVACSKFINLEVLMAQDQDKDVPSKPAGKETAKDISKQTIENNIISIITENENKGRPTDLGEIGSRLVNKYPDFDVRNYGYTALSLFLEEINTLQLVKVNNAVLVSIRDNKNTKNEISTFVINVVKEAGEKGIGLSELSNKVHLHYSDFNLKDYRYSTFSKFIQSIDALEIKTVGMRKRVTLCSK